MAEVDRLKRRVNERTEELAETYRREVGKYTGEQMHDARSTLTRDNDARHQAFKAESDVLTQRLEVEIAQLREHIHKLQHESTQQAIGSDASSVQADFIRTLRSQVEEVTGELTLPTNGRRVRITVTIGRRQNQESRVNALHLPGGSTARK